MDEEYLEGFREIYSGYGDEDIISLLADGEMFFDRDSYRLLCEEALKRGIKVPAGGGKEED